MCQALSGYVESRGMRANAIRTLFVRAVRILEAKHLLIYDGRAFLTP
jgi:hypothetical protein